MRPQIAVVVGTYNRLEQLKACIESIARETSSPYVVYVTDAGSTDGTVEYLRSIASDIVHPRLVGERLGQAKAYNDVFNEATAPYVCWLSDDNVIVNRGLDVALAALKSDARLGMVGLKVQDQQGPFVGSPYGGGVSSIGVLNINQGMLPTPLLQALGGFSETFRFYGIDPDLTARVLFSGWDIALTKAVTIHHFRNWSTEKGSPAWKKMKKTQLRAAQLYNAKYGALHFPSIRYAAKRRVFAALQRLFPRRLAINETRPFLGSLPRDLHNLFLGRFIALADPLTSVGKAHYLVQRCPKRLLPERLPPEPQAFAG